MAKYKNKASDITGPNIYHTKTQTILYDWKTKKGFVLTNDSVKTYAYYQARIPFSLAMGLFVYILTQNELLSALSIIVFIIGTSIFFRFFFLNKLPVIENYVKPEKENYLEGCAKRFSGKRLTVIAILFLFLFYFLILNIKTLGLTGFAYVLYIILAVASLVCLFITLYVKALKNRRKL